MSPSPDKDYVLGTHDAEIDRLGLQHQVWRRAALALWERAGISRGSTVIDAGAGPGFATFDLGEIVGPKGRVIALERSGRFLSHLKEQATRRGLDHVQAVEGDLLAEVWPQGVADFIWCRWVLAFVSDPAAMVAKMARALKPEGALLIQEYSDYRSWRLAPPAPEMDRFVEAVVATWRASGGEPDIGLELPRLLPNQGLTLEHVEAIQFAIRPRDFMWQWPATFLAVNASRQVELGSLTRAEADDAVRVVEERSRDAGSVMLTPVVLQMIAHKHV
jgi:SAM-dependent methyltransferase